MPGRPQSIMNIPIGQQVHAFVELWKKQPRRGRPKLHDYLDEMMPGTNKRTRQRHLKVFAVVSSDDWPDMVALAWISHTPRVTARRYPVFESIINLLQEVGPRSEGDSLFFGLPVRYCARARSN
jgi:hypothetical protein